MGGVADLRGRDAIERAYAAALGAVDPSTALLRRCRVEAGRLLLPGVEPLELARFDGIRVVGAGKCAAGMATALELLVGKTAGGCIAIRDDIGRSPDGIDRWIAGHPLPDVQSLAASSEALRIARNCSPRDLLVCLLSGGASALWAAPPTGVSLADLRELTDRLLRSGAPIHEANVVRKHVSRIAGGRLARASRADRLVTLVISDVVGASPSAIGSGPTLPDPSTFRDAAAVLARYEIEAPPSVRGYLRAGLIGKVPDTPKPGYDTHSIGSFHVLADVGDAVDAAADCLRNLGYSHRVLSKRLRGEARDVGGRIAAVARAARRAGDRRRALLWGGETTVTVRGGGRGGRNQEAALAAAIHLTGDEGTTIAFLGTDGSDGPTDAAGACIDGGTVARGMGRGGDAEHALAENDAYPFLAAAGDLVVTGPTGTNVNDLVIALID